MPFVDHTLDFTDGGCTFTGDSWVFPSYLSVAGQVVVGGWAVGYRPAKIKFVVDALAAPLLSTSFSLLDSANNEVATGFLPISAGTAEFVFDLDFAVGLDIQTLYVTSYDYVGFSYQVFLGDSDGSAGPVCESITLSSYTLDTAAPSATLTITFDAAVEGLTAAHLNTPYCTVTEPLSGDGGITWTATVTAVSGVLDMTNRVVLDLSGITDSLGTNATGTTQSANYTVNTVTSEVITMDFQKISSALRVPGAYIEIDGSQAGLNSGSIPNLLLVGQKLATGTATAGEISLIGSLPDAIAKAGVGSMLAQMAKRFYAINPVLNLYILPLSDNTSGSAATATLDVTAAATAGGTLSLYIAGTLVSVAITTDMTTANVATAIAAAINALDDATGGLPARAATPTDSIVTLTARHFGTCGNGIDLRLNVMPIDAMPLGLVIDITAFSGGTLIPTAISSDNIAAIFDNDDSGYLYAPSKYIALGLSDDVTMAAFHVESQRRYAPPIQSGFRIFTAFSGGYTNAVTYGNSKNYEHICCVGLNGGLTTAWETAAIVAATAAPAMYDNPVRSLEGLALKGLTMALPFTFAQSNSLLYAGLSQVQKSRDGSCSIKRLISMYLHRADDSLDDAFLDINTTETMERIRYEQRMGAIQRFTGMAVARTDEGYRPGLPIITLDTVRAYLLTMYKDTLLREKGWVQEYEYYKSTLILEQDPVNPSRFNYTDQPVILSPFYILAGRAQFRKEVQ